MLWKLAAKNYFMKTITSFYNITTSLLFQDKCLLVLTAVRLWK